MKHGSGVSRRLLGSGEALVLRARGSVNTFKAVAEQTDGDFSLMERTLPPGGRRPLAHRHVTCSEAFFILEGTVTVELEGGGRVRPPRRFREGCLDSRPEPSAMPGIRSLASSSFSRHEYSRKLHELWSAEVPPGPKTGGCTA